MLQSPAMFKKFWNSPWTGAAGFALSVFWEAWWLIGPPIGIGRVERKSYLLWGLVTLVVSSVQGFATLLRRNQNLEQQLRAIADARPRIKLRLPGAVHGITVNHAVLRKGTSDVMTSSLSPFLRVAFYNDPPNSFPTSVAKGVRAYVEFRTTNPSGLALAMEGRWAESDQPPALPDFVSTAKLLEITFGLGETRNLDIAYISITDGKCYAWNNDNYRNFDNNYLTPTHLLPEKSYKVKIRLRGEFVDETFCFPFSVTPDGFNFSQSCTCE
jgi:hypothetical protein